MSIIAGKEDLSVKILTIGESGVGKTSLLVRFTDNIFSHTHLPTIGIDFKSKTIPLESKNVKLKIWDTAGQEKFRNITKNYFNNAEGIIIVFDVTNKRSFDKLDDWLKQIEANIKRDQIELVLVGNKCDLLDREVSIKEGESVALKNGMKYYETSAANDLNVKEMFEGLARQIMKRISDQKNINKELCVRNANHQKLSKVNIKNDNNSKNKTCCR